MPTCDACFGSVTRRRSLNEEMVCQQCWDKRITGMKKVVTMTANANNEVLRTQARRKEWKKFADTQANYKKSLESAREQVHALAEALRPLLVQKTTKAAQVWKLIENLNADLKECIELPDPDVKGCKRLADVY